MIVDAFKRSLLPSVEQLINGVNRHSKYKLDPELLEINKDRKELQ